MASLASGAFVIPFPLARRLRRPELTPEDLQAIESCYDLQDGTSAWRGFAVIGTAAVVLFTTYDRCPSITLRRDSRGRYELATPDGRVLRRGAGIESLLHLFSLALRAG